VNKLTFLKLLLFDSENLWSLIFVLHLHRIVIFCTWQWQYIRLTSIQVQTDELLACTVKPLTSRPFPPIFNPNVSIQEYFKASSSIWWGHEFDKVVSSGSAVLPLL